MGGTGAEGGRRARTPAASGLDEALPSVRAAAAPFPFLEGFSRGDGKHGRSGRGSVSGKRRRGRRLPLPPPNLSATVHCRRLLPGLVAEVGGGLDALPLEAGPPAAMKELPIARENATRAILDDGGLARCRHGGWIVFRGHVDSAGPQCIICLSI